MTKRLPFDDNSFDTVFSCGVFEYFSDSQIKEILKEAFRIAKTIADSPLVKTAIHGADPNWGRIVSAAGYAGVPLREEDMSLRINNLDVYRDGAPLPFDPQTVSNSIRNNRDTHLELTLKLGSAHVRYWTADLTAEYVRLNADYTT